MILENVQSYLVIFGGVNITNSSSVDMNCYYKKNPTDCLQRATNEAFMIREDGKSFHMKIP